MSFSENTWPHLENLFEGQPLIFLSGTDRCTAFLSRVNQLNENDGRLSLTSFNPGSTMEENSPFESVSSEGFVDGWTALPAVQLNPLPEAFSTESNERTVVWVQVVKGWFVQADFIRHSECWCVVKFQAVYDDSIVATANVHPNQIFVK